MSHTLTSELDLALRVRVERIVRPVRAGERRKDRMREELLQHITEAYATEQSVEAAAVRLGDPEKLTRELQASVPQWDRLLLSGSPTPTRLKRWLIRRVDEPIWRYSLRSTWAYVGLLTVCFSGAMMLALVLCALNGRLTSAERMVRLSLFFAGFDSALCVVYFLTPFLADWVHRAVWEKTMPMLMAAAACGLMMLMVAFVALWTGWAAIGYLPYWGPALWVAPIASVGAAVVLVISARQSVLDQRRYARWTSLDLSTGDA